MDIQEIMCALAELGTERTKKAYMREGAREPLFGVATGAMKPLLRACGLNQGLANQLYETGNYDAMYFAGMIAEPNRMTKADYDRWMEGAYFYMIADYIVAVTLAEAEIAQAVADDWIASGREPYVSAGYSCYAWLLGSRNDTAFDPAKLSRMLERVQGAIHGAPDRAKHAMNNFVATVGVSFQPLHEKALAAADAIGEVTIARGSKARSLTDAAAEIRRMADKGKIGFKRRHVRC